MTEWEAELMAARLSRIWGVKNSEASQWGAWVVKESGTSLWAVYEEIFDWSARLPEGVDVRFTSGRGDCILDASLSEGNRFIYLSDCGQIDIGHEGADGLEEFAAKWLAFFRRGCWLSGCPVDATDSEKAEWMRDFSRNHIEEKVEGEAQRVAAAFGLEKYGHWEDYLRQYCGITEGVEVRWGISWSHTHGMVTIHEMDLGEHGGPACRVDLSDYGWRWRFSRDLNCKPEYRGIIAKALYRLGIEDEDVLAELNHPLTAHEKLELRLSMPREFWPQMWLDEGAA